MRKFLLVLLVVAFLLAGCTTTNLAPAPDSDSGMSFAAGSKIPVDDAIYTITGEVVGAVGSLTRQTSAARGNLVAVDGFASGSYYGPEYGGKGFVRLSVTASDSYLAPVGAIVILKSTDTKGSALLPGDTVTFKCRHQYEAVASVRVAETFDADKLETWELDYCRLATPQISP